MPSINRCYRILGRPPGASQEEIKKTYRDLAQVWHPDRFAHNPRLQKKAQDNLQRINEAYETLRSYTPPPGATPSSRLSESFSAIIGIGDMLKTGQFQFQRRPRRQRPKRPRVVVPGEFGPGGTHRARRGPSMSAAAAIALVLVLTAVAALVVVLLLG